MACNKVRQLAKSTHTIAHFDSHADIYICTDSSLTGLGAYIGNCEINDEDKTISKVTITNFFSKPWDIQFSLLSSRARELGAIAAALAHFNVYLPRQKPIYCFTDHKSLEEVHRGDPSTILYNRTRKCLAQILEFPLLRIKYLPATDKLIDIADKLSRSFKFYDYQLTFTLQDMNKNHIRVGEKMINNLNYKKPLQLYHKNNS